MPQNDSWMEGEGDGTVPEKSAQMDGIVTELDQVGAEHGKIPLNPMAIKEVLEQIIPGYSETPSVPEEEIQNALYFEEMCPLDLVVIDPAGNKTGIQDGEKINDIPNAVVWGLPGKGQSIWIFNPQAGGYKITSTGVGNGWGVIRCGVTSEQGDYARDMFVPIENDSVNKYNAYVDPTSPPSESIKVTPNLKVDVISGTKGEEGWYTSPVTVQCQILDGEAVSIAFSVNGGTYQPYQNEVTFQDDGISAVVFKNETNGEMAAITLKIDQTPPVLEGTPETTPNADGWYSSDVKVCFTAFDDTSGISTVTPDTTISTEGALQSVTGTATDNAGNTATVNVPGINMDKTAPVIAITSPVPGILADPENFSVAYSVYDNLAGVAGVAATLDGADVQNGQSVDLLGMEGRIHLP